MLETAASEAWRVEHKWSRYRPDNVVHAINTADGRSVTVDAETARLIDYAARASSLERREVRYYLRRAAQSVALRRQRPRAAACGRQSAARPRRLEEGHLEATANHATARHADRIRRYRQGVCRRPCRRVDRAAVEQLFAQLRRRPICRWPSLGGPLGCRHRVSARVRRRGGRDRAYGRGTRDERGRAPLPAQTASATVTSSIRRPAGRSKARRARSRSRRRVALRPACSQRSHCCKGATPRRSCGRSKSRHPRLR